MDYQYQTSKDETSGPSLHGSVGNLPAGIPDKHCPVTQILQLEITLSVLLSAKQTHARMCTEVQPFFPGEHRRERLTLVISDYACQGHPSSQVPSSSLPPNEFTPTGLRTRGKRPQKLKSTSTLPQMHESTLSLPPKLWESFKVPC